MSIMPDVVWNPLIENYTQGKIKPIQIILHTAVDAPGPTRLQPYFNRVDITVESHFWIPRSRPTEQMMDTNVRADANNQANRTAISIETEDEGDPVGLPWNEYQINEIVRVCKWAAEEHGIPMVICGTPTSPGIGYHSMFGAPSAWTPSRGKTCPGSTRIKQFYSTIIPRLQEEDEEMAVMNRVDAAKFTKALYGAIVHRKDEGAGAEYWISQFTGKTKVEALLIFIESASAEVDNLQDRVKALEVMVQDIKPMTVVQNTQIDYDKAASLTLAALIKRLS